MAPLVRTGGSRHTGLAAPPHRNIQAAFTANVPSELTHITAVIAEAIKRLSVFFFISFLSFHKINIKDVENKNDAGELLRYKVMDPLTLAS